jgi:hypothetical protein
MGLRPHPILYHLQQLLLLKSLDALNQLLDNIPGELRLAYSFSMLKVGCICR